MNFADNPLIRRTLAPQPSPDDLHAEPRARLWRALLQMRERAAMLANEIHRDLPDFTVHDITHLDALWEMADLIAGPDYPLNPMEAFALGAVFLLHDLGLGLAAWPGGLDELKKGPGWEDALSTYLRKHLERIPTVKELASPPLEIERMAVQERLRTLHAEQAERLALAAFPKVAKEGETVYQLIEDPDLRQAIGPLLGKIAHSHWWPVSRLGSEFSTVRGSLSWCHRDWTLDPLKIAVLLRTADAAHLDERRAPGFLIALRRPEGISKNHWHFQNHLLKPQVEGDRLVYTTARPFPPEEVDAWWLCEETLRMVDRELHQVDSLLADRGSPPRLHARSVAGVESPRRLQKYIGVSGWAPVDARLHVSNVAELVGKLGGEQLYGNDLTVPLRELIQNASDAIRARRLLEEERPDNWGQVTVRLGQDAQGPWVEVEDNGIGMSEAVLTGPLLGFGTTYWGSVLMQEEYEGLWAKGFEPTGHFGIGFFSVFMWGNRVRVTARSYRDAPRDTKILEFREGPKLRSLLRSAKPEEQLREGSTRVRIWLNNDPQEKGGLLWLPSMDKPVSLGALCAWLAPALDVDIYVEEPGLRGRRVVAASDWLVITEGQLLARLSLDPPTFDKVFPENFVKEIEANGRVIGRASIFHTDTEIFFNNPVATGVITVGGLRARSISSIFGILAGYSRRASRYDPKILDALALAEWASDQAALIEKEDFKAETQVYGAASVLAFGGDPGRLPVARRGEDFVDREAIENWRNVPDKIILFSINFSRQFERRISAVLNYNVLGGFSSLAHYEFRGERILVDFFRDALAQAWGCFPQEVKVEKSSLEYDVGINTDGTVLTVSNVTIFQKPAS